MHYEPRNSCLPFSFKPSETPRLLVSVRNSEEALAAISGGCDILDIKEPGRGSLGMADRAIVTGIIETVRAGNPDLIISAALGEVLDWETASVDCTRFEEFVPRGCQLLKLGCAGLGARADWRETLNQTRASISNVAGSQSQSVAVAYVDSEAANSPRVEQIVEAALEDHCSGLLLDTFTKSGRWLLDWISIAELREISDRVHKSGLFLAVAGSVSSKNLPHLQSVPADIIAIRGAACLEGVRQSLVSEAAVREFKRQIGPRSIPE